MKVTDSILFLSCARKALKEQVLKSQLEEIKKVAFSEFLMNEATDYEIMSLLVNNKLPEEKYNTEAETYLFAEFKELVIENYSNLAEAIDKSALVSVIYEVGPVSLYGYSTAVPVLEFLMEKYKAKTYAQTMAPMFRKAKVKGAISSAKRTAQQQAHYAKQAIGGAAGKVTGATKAAAAYAKGHKAKTIGGAALAALASYGAMKAYQRWMSAGAKACKGKSGADRTACLQQYKQKAEAAKAAAKKK